MKFYKVKEYHDFSDGRVLVKRELLSEKTVKKYKYPLHWFEEVEVRLADTYWFFGARFAIETEV